MDFKVHTHIITVEQLKSHSGLWHMNTCYIMFLILTYDIDAKSFKCHSTLLDYCSFHSLYPGCDSCFQGRHPKQREFSEKEAKLTRVPLQKAVLGAQGRGTSRDVRYQGNHPNVKTSLHTVLSSPSNKLQFPARETGGIGE